MLLLLYIPQLFGISIEVYFFLIIISLPIFFFWKWLFKKLIPAFRTRIILTWITTIIITPIIYVGIVFLVFSIIESYPKNDFDRKQWLSDKDERYELTDDIINRRLLIGKSKDQVLEILGDENNSNTDNWGYYIGFKPEIGNIDPNSLHIDFKNNRAINVSVH
jgi:hypothetical protein